MKKALIFSLLATGLLYVSCETSRLSSTANTPATVAATTPAQPEMTQFQKDSAYWVEQKKAAKSGKAKMKMMDMPANAMDKNLPTPVTKQNPKQ